MAVCAARSGTPSTGLQLAGHIYCADKGDFYDLADGLPCADRDDPVLTTMVP